MKLTELQKPIPRAGLYPYYIDSNENIYVHLMIPSNSEFGGSEPQLAKGKIDSGESIKDGAIREACEELGLKKENLKFVRPLFKDVTPSGRDIHVFYGEVFDKDNFGQFHYETGWAGWIEINEAIVKTRKWQKKYLNKLQAILEN